MGDIEKQNNRAPLLGHIKICALFQSLPWIQTGVTVRKRSIQVKIFDFFFITRDLEIWRMTLKNNWAPLLSYVKLCASFRTHRSIQTGIAVLKRPIRVNIDDILSRVTLKFERWHWKTIRHIFHVTSSFVHHFLAICKFNLELQSINAQFGSKLAIFCPVWPWNFMDDLKNK